jgi:hypothetical protein
MFRIRDHIISLVGVFLALGVGILIGTGLSDDMLVKQQRLLIDQMTMDVRTLREERSALETRLQIINRDLYLWEKYQDALYPGMVAGALEEKNIAIVCQGADIPPGVLRLLQDADATLCSVIFIAEGRTIGANPAELGEALAALAGNRPLTAKMSEALQPYLDEKVLRYETYARQSPHAVIFMLGEREHTDSRLVEETVKSLGHDLILVGLEWSHVQESVLESLKAAGMSTIDNAETVFGQYSLMAVLRGSAGNYGIKAAADDFIANF